MKFLLLPVYMILVPSCRETSTTIIYYERRRVVQFSVMCFHLEMSMSIVVYVVLVSSGVCLHVWRLSNCCQICLLFCKLTYPALWTMFLCGGLLEDLSLWEHGAFA